MEHCKIVEEQSQRYPMGITVLDRKIHVSVVSAAKSCSLVLFEKDGEEDGQRIPMDPALREGDVWNLTLEGKWPRGTMYCFEMDGKMTPDPCGRQFTGWEQWGDPENIKHVMMSPLYGEAFDWQGDKKPMIPFHEMVVYRCHVRGMTCHQSSKVRNKGTFRALMDKLPYIKDLGATTIELMPVNEFQEVLVQESEWNPRAARGPEPTGKLNYWGYTGGYYYAPKASYSSGQKKRPVYEFKTLVREIHKAGMEVVVELYFGGKETPSSVLDILRFWVQEYHVDGVHLVGQVPTVLVAGDPYLSRTKLFATSWSGADAGAEKHLAEYHDGFLTDMRRVLKGDEDQIRPLMFRLGNNPKDHGVINYMANTNGFTMMDMVSYERKHNDDNQEGNRDGSDYNCSWNCGLEGISKKKKIVKLRRRQIRNALALVFLSQGTPLLLAGDEFGNSKSGNNNSYCQDNEISWLNWNQQKSNGDIYDFVRFIINFRRSHPVFHMEKAAMNMDYLACGHPDMSFHGEKAWRPEYENFRRQLGVLYCGDYGKLPDGTSDDYFYVIYNMHWEPHEFGPPRLPGNRRWHVAVDTGNDEINGYYESGEEPLLEDQRLCRAEGRSVVVLIGKVHEELEVKVSKKSEKKKSPAEGEKEAKRR